MGASNLTLYAVWTTNPTFTVTYDGNGATGGSAPVDGNTHAQGQTITVLGNTGALARAGYSYKGWNTQADGSGTSYTQGQTFVMPARSVTLYAQWTALPTYSVIYEKNGATGGSVPVDTNHYYAGESVTVLGNPGNLVKSGYAFTGWNQNCAGTGTTYTAGQTFSMAAVDVALCADWTPSPTYTVTYDANGGTGSVRSTRTSTRAGRPSRCWAIPEIYRCPTRTSTGGARRACAATRRDRPSRWGCRMSLCTPTTPASPTGRGSTSIGSGGCKFYVGSVIQTPDGQCTLMLKADGELVLTSYLSGGTAWTSQSTCSSAWYWTLQTDGNLVVYCANSASQPYAIWASNTGGHPNDTLSLVTNYPLSSTTRGCGFLIYAADGMTALFAEPP